MNEYCFSFDEISKKKFFSKYGHIFSSQIPQSPLDFFDLLKDPEFQTLELHLLIEKNLKIILTTNECINFINLKRPF